MTQTSFFWDGTTTGDATLAPYDDGEIAAAITDITGNFVVPGYLFGTDVPKDELLVEPGAIGLVTVNAGAAMVHGALYVLDASTTLAIPATPAANPAIYRIVLTRDIVTQLVRVSVSEGADAAVPRPPVVAADEFTLAWIYVTGAYNPAADLVSDVNIHDERVFKYIGPDALKHQFENILHNVEFYGISRGANAAPDGWTDQAAPTGITYGFAGNRVPRGNWVRFQGATGKGMKTTIPMGGSNDESEVRTIRGFIEVDVGAIDIEIYALAFGAAPGLIETKRFEVVATPTAALEGLTEFIIRVPVSPASSVYEALQIIIISAAAVTDAYIGNMAVIPGYVAGTHATVRKHETIMLDNALTDGNWTATAKNTGATTIALNADFGGVILSPGLRGVIAKLRCRDSGSAAAAVDNGAAIEAYHFGAAAAVPGVDYVGAVSCARLPNDSWTERVVFIPLDPADANSRFILYVRATGAGLLDATVEIVGLVT